MKDRTSVVFKIVVILIFTVVLSGCARHQYNPATGQEETLFYSVEKEVKLGKKLARKIEEKYDLLDDKQQQERIDRIGHKIALVSDRQDIKYHFDIIEDENANAVALPGGYVYISSKLVEEAQTDDQIAAVLAHEVGHIAAYHSVKKMQGNFLYTFLKILSLSAQAEPGFHRGSDFAYVSIMMEYSQEFEKQADCLSVVYLERAGFDPYATIAVLEKLQKLDEEEPLRKYSYFRTHPPIATRKAVIRKQITGDIEYEDYLNLLNE